MKRAWLLGWLLCACSSDPMMTPDGGGGDAQTTMPKCDIAASIDVMGTPTPGASVKLSIKETGARTDYTVAWSATLGTIAPQTGKSVDWALDKTIAVNGPAMATITATVSASGCDDKTLTLDRTIEWTDAQRTIVLYNTMQAGSKNVADYYATFRNIPQDHLCAITSDPTSVDDTGYMAILDAVLACYAKVGPHVYYVVPVFGVPYLVQNKIGDLANMQQKVAVSLDSLLALADRSRTLAATIKSPMYQTGSSIQNKYNPYVPFGELRAKYAKDFFLVARIDGADEMAAKSLVDRTKVADDLARKKQLSGTVYVDGNRGTPHPMTDQFGSYESGEWNMVGTENVFKAAMWPKIVADYNSEEFGTAPAPTTCPDALYYAGWYAFNHYNDAFTWNPGAIGGHLDSCSACSFRGNTSWSAVALKKGITATFGAVGEPYVAGMPEYDQFFLYLLQGASFGEAAYESTYIGGWMMVWLGDPLYRPYAK